MTGMMPDSGVPYSDAKNSLSDPNTIRCKELWYSTSRCQPRFDPAAANAMLSELINLINCAGLVYDCAKLNNVSQAITSMLRKVAFAVTTVNYKIPGNHTWVVPEGVENAYVRLWGGGGSGGGHLAIPEHNPHGGHSGSGGGSGAYSEGIIKNLKSGTVITIEVGAGGSSVTGDVDGEDGGESRFGNYIWADGGIGGQWAGGGPWFQDPDFGNVQFAGDKIGQVNLNPAEGYGGSINLPGSMGFKGDMCMQIYTVGHGGPGGSAPFGGGGGATSTTYGYPGTSPGGGGGGGGGSTPNSTSSGRGGNGWVILQFVDPADFSTC